MTAPFQQKSVESILANFGTRIAILEAVPPFIRNAHYEIKLFSDTVTATTGDGKFIFAIPEDLDGFSLFSAEAFVSTVSSSGNPTIQVRNVSAAVDMLSTRITIDSGEPTSYTAATPSVVNSLNALVATGQLIALDVDVAGTSAKGLGVILVFSLL